MFEDDFSADNKVQFNGAFNSVQSKLKFNAVMQNSNKDGLNSFLMSEDAEIQTNVFDKPAKVKFSNKNVKGTLSLKKYSWNCKKNNCAINLWCNSYAEAKFNRNLQNTTFSYGALSHVNNSFMENLRFNF